MMLNYEKEVLDLKSMEPYSFSNVEINRSEIGYDNLWESELYNKLYFKRKKGFSYYDSSNIFKYLFFGWVNKWSRHLSKSTMEPYKLHPLPVSDQILYWQPIFSKHVSDGLVRLENYETNKTKTNEAEYVKPPYKSILFRATLLTFWKRTLFVLLGIIATNILSMSISILVKKLLKILNDRSISFIKILLFLLLVIILQVIDGLLIENFTFYMYRLIHLIQYSYSITTFQHGLCYRRKYFNNIEGFNTLNVCNNVLHSCSPDSDCSKNPLYCPARRYQNKDIAPNMFSFEYTDPFYISMLVESLFFIINFLSSFVYGILLLSFQIKVNIWVLYILGFCFVICMLIIEIVNTYVLKIIFLVRDYKISKSNEIIISLPIINKMFIDDIAINIITKARNNELGYFLIRIFLTFFNRSLYIIFKNVSFYILKCFFVKSIVSSFVITDVDTAGFITSLYIFLRVVDSMFMLPHAFKRITSMFVSYNRVKNYTNECSPNFYISDNKFTGKIKMTTDLNNITNQINKDVVVLYSDASFSWINNRKDVINEDFDYYLENINFELKRGEVAIITGSQGSGKSNFIKSVLGEMTLVGGSMAVVPLHTSMPIFYASQDIWLQQGTIRSNILFGYKFDESLYNVVLKAVELEYDISTWEHGDMRFISDYAHTLSGGQRVRMELARALYAYMVFSQVNNQYNEGKCSFLMCLDSSFNGLDPFVSKTIFNNLFNSKSGLLIKNDLSVILTFSTQFFERFILSFDKTNFTNISLYYIKDQELNYHCKLHEFGDFNIQHNKYSNHHSTSNYTYYSDYFNSDVFKICSSGHNTRNGRQIITKMKYERSFKSYVNEQLSGFKFNPYILYFTPARFLFVVFIILTFTLTIMDNVKFVFATNLSDYITKNINDYNNGETIDMSDVKLESNHYKNVVFVFVILIVLISLLTTLFFSISCIISSRKIHEYCIDSIFNNSSEVLKIKENISQIITFLSCDIYHVDEGVCYEINLSIVSLIETVIHVVTLFYLIPLSIPFALISLLFVFNFVFLQYINSNKNLQFVFLEALGNINNVCENAITGTSICRSFKKEWEFMNNLIEHTDYYMRYRLLNKAFVAWSSILFNWIFSSTTFVILLFLILFDKYTGFKLRVGYFGLGISLSMNVVKSFTKFSLCYARLEMFMCSISRLQYFVPPKTKFRFTESINIHEEDIVDNYYFKIESKKDTKKLMNIRMIEFLEENKRFRALKKLFFNPKINVVDVTKYVTPEHSGVELKDVRVYTSLEKNVEGMILKGLTVSAHKSDIIGIIGRTGAGKTTLLSVLENTMRNRTGQVLLDGRDLNDIPKNVTRQIIGVLPQLPFVFKGWTVRRFLDPRKLFSDDEINEALSNCGLLDFVNNLQGGKNLDSVIIPEDIDLSNQNPNLSNKSSKGLKSYKSERSLTMDTLKIYYQHFDLLLSNSQLRTLSFARLVLYRYFYRMIIIDEPPSENCEEGDENTIFLAQDVGLPIYELLQKYFKHCTSFVTAHDVNVLKMCSSVWVIHDGRLIRTCKTKDILSNDSISNIIENVVNLST